MNIKSTIDLLRKVQCPQNVIAHCIAVSELADEMAKNCDADREIVIIGALLHDMGYARSNSVNHALIGAEMARDFGLDDRIVDIIERHIGAGIPKEEAEELGLPKKNYMPKSLEEKIVAHADNLTRHTKQITINEAIEAMQRKLGKEHPSIERIRRLHEELEEICGLRDIFSSYN
ncbi:MAG: TIGR00295 family protein [Methanocellales archaeon]|nr:TIGR00295 family protein [Methanocellales archaeon]